MNLRSEPIVPFTTSLHPPKTRALTKPNPSGSALPIYFLFFLKTTTVPPPPTKRLNRHNSIENPQGCESSPRTPLPPPNAQSFIPYLLPPETHSLENQKVGTWSLISFLLSFDSTRPATYTGTSTITRNPPQKKKKKKN